MTLDDRLLVTASSAVSKASVGFSFDLFVWVRKSLMNQVSREKYECMRQENKSTNIVS